MSEPTDPECGSRWPVGHGHRAHVKRQRMTAASMGGAMGAKKALCKPRLALSETKLALLPGSTGSTGTKLSLPPGSAAHPVQNSPGTPQNADFGPLFARRENLLPLSPPTTRAGRTLSRMQSRFRYKTVPARGLSGRYRYETLPAHTPDGPTRYKTLPARPARRPTRYKILPARPKTLISAHFSPAGRTLYRFRHQHDEQGEKSHAPTPHLSQPTPHLSQPTPHLSQPTPHLSPATCRSPNFACNSIA